MPPINNQVEATLLPCPFCGAEAEYAENEFLGDNSTARCCRCGAEAYFKKWNTRADRRVRDADIERAFGIGLLAANTAAIQHPQFRVFFDAVIEALSAESPSRVREAALEEAARVAEADHRSEEARRLGYEPEYHIAGQKIAAAIRALATPAGEGVTDAKG